MGYQKVKGTQDFFELSALKFRYLEKIVTDVIKNYGFQEIMTPIFENTDVFTRSVGDESDIVSKEMYSFKDKGERSITLRPEGTAAVVRSFLENKLYVNSNINKFYYFGPMFRYERPQAGRYRQFHQFGIEAFGESGPLLDSDVIMSAYKIFKTLGITNIKLKINSIGDKESRIRYAKVLQKYFSSHIDSLCSDCKRRLSKNPMRILDCKVDKDNPILIQAPKIKASLNQSSLAYFQKVLSTLDYFEIDYEVDESLVRGLDYYTDTVFEYIYESNDELNDLAICAGGKYSDLIKSFGGPDIPGIGYAFGVERIMALMDKADLFKNIEKNADVVFITLDDESKILSLKYANQLRQHGYYVEMDYLNTQMKPQFKLADKMNAKMIIIIGEEERLNKKITIKNKTTNTQEQIDAIEMLAYLERNLRR